MGIFKNSLMKMFPAGMVSRLYAFKEIFFSKRFSYSFEGEDMVLNNLFAHHEKGFYVDIGANHPQKYSNTYFFYRRGWRGINIDATPGSMWLFKFFRRRDINLEVPISNKIEMLKYYLFNDSRLNSFSKNLSDERVEKTNYKIIKEIEIQTDTLKNILDKHLPKNIIIDFMSIDVEGHDYHVLVSNDWTRYKPTVIVIEQLGNPQDSVTNSEIYRFLKGYNYALLAKTGNSCIYGLTTDKKITHYFPI